MIQRIHWFGAIGVFSLMLVLSSCSQRTPSNEVVVSEVLQRVAEHSFNPLNEDFSLTIDHEFKEAGIPDLDDKDWQVRLLGVRDLVRAGTNSVDEIVEGLQNSDEHVRQVCDSGVQNQDRNLHANERPSCSIQERSSKLLIL